jgi:suppressor of ftsI
MNKQPTQKMNMKATVTRPQLIAVTVLSLLALFTGIVIATLYGNFIMRPNDRENQAGQENFSQSTIGLPTATKMEQVELKNGDSYDLTASMVKKTIQGKEVKMLAYNGSIPGPIIRVPQGAEITINFKNNTDVDSTIHSHGIRLDSKFDGVAGLTQKAVRPGESFSYSLKFPDAGVFWYHPHVREDYAQELGLYGNYLVTSTQTDYWGEADREEALFLDDILVTNGQIAPFSKTTIDHALMGRFGNVMLINGDDTYTLPVKQGERVRLYLTNAASTRVFNVSIPNARMKLVGADNGKYEREEWVDSILLGPSERSIVEVWFDKAGEYQIIHKTPEKTYTMGTIAVESRPVTTSYLLAPRVNQDMVEALTSLRPLFSKAVDKKLTLSLDMMGNEDMMQNQGNSGGHKMSDGSMTGGNQMSMENTDTDKIEWEDTMSMMNTMATSKTLKWKLVDQATNSVNMDINWKFKIGDKVKLSIFNDPKSVHPMQHPMHIHGQKFLVLSTNGVSNDNMIWKDTVLVQKGDTVDLLVDMENPGEWLIHCHIPEHMEAGMMTNFKVL